MATSHRPLLDKPKSLNYKNLCLFLSLAAISGSAAQLFPIDNIINQALTPSQICEGAHDPTSCHALLVEFANSYTTTSLSKPERLDLLQVFLKESVLRVENAIKTVAHEGRNRLNGARDEVGLADCVELMDLSMYRMVSSMDELNNKNPSSESYGNVHSWLSSVLTNYMTCLDGINDSVQAKAIVEPRLNDLVSRARTALAILVSISPAEEDELTKLVTRRFPAWLSVLDRRLLESSPDDVKANADVVVAKDGSGKYKTLSDAVAAAPSKNENRYVIYVRKGVYEENVEIKKKNLTLVGDGMDTTIITGSLNMVDGTGTILNATVTAVGDYFIAQDICFQNTAGPEKLQAVALRVGADKSVINRCRIDAYQDTLFSQSLRQFYRDCYITGTIDFIFGNAAVVLQNCTIVARKPLETQKNMVTAQGRIDPNQATGTSIQKCNVIASSDLKPLEDSIQSFLGRPWKNYSRTVFMQSYIGKLIDPAGWHPWVGDLYLSTLYYGEYDNYGPGADTSKRVDWEGYRVITDPKEAEQFTVAKLIQGDKWLDPAGVAYKPGL